MEEGGGGGKEGEGRDIGSQVESIVSLREGRGPSRGQMYRFILICLKGVRKGSGTFRSVWEGKVKG